MTIYWLTADTGTVSEMLDIAEQHMYYLCEGT